MKKIAILGSTGSIGRSTLRVVQHLPNDLSVSALAVGSNIALLSKQIPLFKPEIVAVYDEKKAAELKERFPSQKIVSGDAGLEEITSHPSIDFVVVAIVGMQALKPMLYAINSGKQIGLASKEVLVAAGELISQMVCAKGLKILPIDSEHSAIFQCLERSALFDVRRLILTASGGPFRLRPLSELATVTVSEALAHPTWNMGNKVSIDSSTLINKGLEMIEARWLFNILPSKIEVVIHPQSIVHSFVEFIDGSILAQLSEPDMVNPIQYALSYPKRKPGMFPPFDFVKNSKLEFFTPDHQKFPALSLVEESLRMGGSAPCYLNAANEILVARFLKQEISWLEIIQKLEKLLSRYHAISPDTIETVLDIDKEARKQALVA